MLLVRIPFLSCCNSVAFIMKSTNFCPKILFLNRSLFSLNFVFSLQIESVNITGFEKRHDREQGKYYVYVVEVKRADGRVSRVFRRFRCVGGRVGSEDSETDFDPSSDGSLRKKKRKRKTPSSFQSGLPSLFQYTICYLRASCPFFIFLCVFSL